MCEWFKKLAVLNELVTINVVDSNCFGMASVNFEISSWFKWKNISDDWTRILEEGTNEFLF